MTGMQKGGDAAELEAKKKDLEAKRAANATRSVKTFYKVTVEVGSELPLPPSYLGPSHGYCS